MAESKKPANLTPSSKASKPAAAAKGAPASPSTGASTPTPAGTPKGDVTIVDRPTSGRPKAKAKPTLTPRQQERLRLRAAIAGRRPAFRRQQWYEYKRLADTGWRYPRGVDSAMRRHFGYEQPVVRIGFRGPAEVRGLHPTGFVEVRVETVKDLAKIDPKTQAARVAGSLGSRTLKLVYAEADKLGVRVLNRRRLA